MRIFGADNRVIVRPLTRDTVPAFLPVLVELDAASRAELGDRYSEEDWVEEHFLAELPSKWSLSHVAIGDDVMVGFIIGSRKSGAAHVNRFAVASERRNLGVGRALLDALVSSAIALRLNPVSLTVAEENLAAIRFYLGAGFARGNRLRTGGLRQLSMSRHV